MRENITASRAEELTKDCQIHLHFSKEWRWVDKQCEQEEWHNTHDLLPLGIFANRWLCAVDVGYGANFVVDLQTKKSWKSKNEIVENDFVFVSDYHGYPHGAFYLREL